MPRRNGGASCAGWVLYSSRLPWYPGQTHLNTIEPRIYSLLRGREQAR